jgi:hypothetical protein
MIAHAAKMLPDAWIVTPDAEPAVAACPSRKLERSGYIDIQH